MGVKRYSEKGVKEGEFHYAVSKKDTQQNAGIFAGMYS
jgi:hypothetical protein